MSRDIFSKQSAGWHRDARCRALKHPSYKWLNNVMWNLCVEQRCDTLPNYINAAHLAHESGIDVRTVRKCLTFMQQECSGLITKNSDDSITVHGVRKIHETANFVWKDGFENISENINVCKDVDINVDTNAEKSVPREEKSKRREENTLMEDVNLANCDLPKSQRKIISPLDVMAIVTFIKSNYRPDIMGNHSSPYIDAILQDFTKDQVIKAIKQQINVSDALGREQSMRPPIEKEIGNVGLVTELLEDASKPIQAAPSAYDRELREVLLEVQRKHREKENDQK